MTDIEALRAERDALSAVIDNVRALCVELTTELPLRILNGDAVVRVSDVTRRIYLVLAAGLAAPVGETPDEPARCNHGHTGEHAFDGLPYRCPGPALPVEEQQRVTACIEDVLGDLPRPEVGWTWWANEVRLALVDEGFLAGEEQLR